MNLRRRLGSVERSAERATPLPNPWDYIDADPTVRMLYVIASMPVPVLEVARALRESPEWPAVQALADRHAPALAVVAAQVSEALEQMDTTGELEAVPTPPGEATGYARALLMSTRYGRDGPPPHTGTVEAAAAALVLYRSWLAHNLNRCGAEFESDPRSVAGLRYLFDYAP